MLTAHALRIIPAYTCPYVSMSSAKRMCRSSIGATEARGVSKPIIRLVQVAQRHRLTGIGQRAETRALRLIQCGRQPGRSFPTVQMTSFYILSGFIVVICTSSVREDRQCVSKVETASFVLQRVSCSQEAHMGQSRIFDVQTLPARIVHGRKAVSILLPDFQSILSSTRYGVR